MIAVELTNHEGTFEVYGYAPLVFTGRALAFGGWEPTGTFNLPMTWQIRPGRRAIWVTDYETLTAVHRASRIQNYHAALQPKAGERLWLPRTNALTSQGWLTTLHTAPLALAPGTCVLTQYRYSCPY